jgi:hypothetical protein
VYIGMHNTRACLADCLYSDFLLATNHCMLLFLCVYKVHAMQTGLEEDLL